MAARVLFSINTAVQIFHKEMKFSINDFFSKCDQIWMKLFRASEHLFIRRSTEDCFCKQLLGLNHLTISNNLKLQTKEK